MRAGTSPRSGILGSHDGASGCPFVRPGEITILIIRMPAGKNNSQNASGQKPESPPTRDSSSSRSTLDIPPIPPIAAYM